MKIPTQKSDWEWENIADYYGFVCVGATLKGTDFSQNDVSVPAVGGVRVANPQEGVYIRRQGSNVSKEYIR
ncbi:MAG: hypothetical protein HDS68_07830 [Bacteroidales bacterium]|nr:hypothetical protein [Bacteroidales bacterium]